MKLVLVTGIFPPDIGGPATYIPRFADFLISRDHDVKVVTLADNVGVQPRMNYPVTRIPRQINRILRFFLVVIKITFLPRGTIILANGLHEEVGISLLLRPRKAIAKIVGDPIWERARNKGATESNIENFNIEPMSTKMKFQRFLLKSTLNRFEAITAPSIQLCSLVENWGVQTKTHYIANGVEINDINRGKSAKVEFDLISVSRLVPWKNVDKHILLAKELNKNLIILGSGPESESLELLAKKIGADVTFAGEKSKDETRKYLQKSKVFLLLSSYEGMSFALLEAMSMGLPAVISDIPSNTDVARDGIESIVLNDETWDLRMDLVAQLLEDKDKYLTMSQNAIARIAQEYSEISQFAKMEKLLLN